MTLPIHEFIRRFLIHVLPKGVHRIRHYGLFANGNRAANIARARELLARLRHLKVFDAGDVLDDPRGRRQLRGRVHDRRPAICPSQFQEPDDGRPMATADRAPRCHHRRGYWASPVIVVLIIGKNR
jgi:hypothetical protein